jgi:hypothetical protein
MRHAGLAARSVDAFDLVIVIASEAKQSRATEKDWIASSLRSQ